MTRIAGTHTWSIILVAGIVSFCGDAIAQFSPGDLSRAHHHLEGTQNCVSCHEVGKEISGGKCLSCHAEIQTLLTTQRGFHAKNASQLCIACHKEHLGIDARTMKFDSTGFDHSRTGYMLSGRHLTIACVACHNRTFIRDTTVIGKLNTMPHMTYLGLLTECGSCHRDPHKGRFRQPCSTCHTSDRWGNIHGFDHSTTKFPLTGKHGNVGCSKCHGAMKDEKSTQKVDFSTKPFGDCTPCHDTPHGPGFQGRACTSCHSAESWGAVSTTSFDHTLPAYELRGRHRNVECASCHRRGPGKRFKDVFLRSHAKCTDCHEDKHEGVFAAKYTNNCATCHTVFGFSPSTVTISQHREFKFELTGGHLALPCVQCHKRKGEKSQFRFNPIECSTCHADVHKGQFNDLMQGKSCASCHNTNAWKPARYNHAATSFPLEGKHASVSCSSCHKEVLDTTMSKVKYLRLKRECESCHTDNHAGQFQLQGYTNCSTCHTAQDWKARGFNHDRSSTFHLTGGHIKVPCASCHRSENNNGKTIIRYKPLSAACSSCHQGKELKP